MRQDRPGRREPDKKRASSRRGRGGGKRRTEGEVLDLSSRRRSRQRPRRGNGASSGGRKAAPKTQMGKRRLQLVALAVALAGLVLGGRAAYLSVVQFEDFQALAAENEGAEQLQSRGDILGAGGRELATSLQASKIVATPYQIQNPEKAADRLAEALGESGPSVSKIEESLTKRDGKGNLAGYSVIAEEVDPRVAAEIEKLQIAGISTESDATRQYPHEQLASQVLGYLGDYKNAFGGVEAAYNDDLSAGEDVNLTIDAAVQQQLQQSLDEAVKDYDATGGVGVVMRVDDGEVVAMANSPSYDNNEFGQAAPQKQRNRVIADPYEPGSTFKPFTVAAAIEDGAVQPDQSFTVPDSMEVSGVPINDSHEHETEEMSVSKILQESSNVGTTKIAQELGGRALSEYIKKFGFGEPTGIDLPGEAAGNILPYDQWSGVSIANIAFGQGISVTPLQLTAAYAALANGGLEVEPNVVEQSGSDGATGRMISADTSDIVRGMLQNVVDDGTGRYAQIPGYSVAGKTGTSEKIDPETGSYGDSYITSFVGFAPASDPEYVTLIAVDEPEESKWGEVVAAPAFQEVMSFTLSYYNVAPDRPDFEAPGLETSPSRNDEDGLPGYEAPKEGSQQQSSGSGSGDSGSGNG